MHSIHATSLCSAMIYIGLVSLLFQRLAQFTTYCVCNILSIMQIAELTKSVHWRWSSLENTLASQYPQGGILQWHILRELHESYGIGTHMYSACTWVQIIMTLSLTCKSINVIMDEIAQAAAYQYMGRALMCASCKSMKNFIAPQNFPIKGLLVSLIKPLSTVNNVMLLFLCVYMS